MGDGADHGSVVYLLPLRHVLWLMVSQGKPSSTEVYAKEILFPQCCIDQGAFAAHVLVGRDQWTFLSPSIRGLSQRLSIFADNIMVFLKPEEVELRACAMILEMFGMASGLRVNLSKSAAVPIHCSLEEVMVTHNMC